MIRPIRKTDEDFIYHSWIHTVKNPCHAITDMTRLVIDGCVANESIRIYCSNQDEDHIIGWIAYGELQAAPLLHMLFVKRDLRSNGVGTELFESVFGRGNDCVIATHWSHKMNRLRAKWNVKYVGNMLAAVVYSTLSPAHA